MKISVVIKLDFYVRLNRHQEIIPDNSLPDIDGHLVELVSSLHSISHLKFQSC